MISQSKETKSYYSNEGQAGKRVVIINERYALKNHTKKHTKYEVYDGIDITAHKMVTVYMKRVKMMLNQSDVEFSFSQKIKKEVRQKISPTILWNGRQKINSVSYSIEIHEKFGPSLNTMFKYITVPLSDRDFLVLLYQLIRLIERYSNLGYVHRSLDLKEIVFDAIPHKNELFLLNVFELKRQKNQNSALFHKYGSRGSHLGLDGCIKDDLESICYMLIDIYTQGNFLKNIHPHQYLNAKSKIDISSFGRTFPSLFVDFFTYVMGLGHGDEPYLFKWRSFMIKIIGTEYLSRPYQWMKSKQSSNASSSTASQSIEQEDRPPSDCDIEDELTPIDRFHLQKLSIMMISERT